MTEQQSKGIMANPNSVKIVTICGSMKCYRKMLKVAPSLTKQGVVVQMRKLKRPREYTRAIRLLGVENPTAKEYAKFMDVWFNIGSPVQMALYLGNQLWKETQEACPPQQ